MHILFLSSKGVKTYSLPTNHSSNAPKKLHFCNEIFKPGVMSITVQHCTTLKTAKVLFKMSATPQCPFYTAYFRAKCVLNIDPCCDKKKVIRSFSSN